MAHLQSLLISVLIIFLEIYTTTAQSETGCARAFYFPLNICLKMNQNSYKTTCDGNYVYNTLYDDNQCQGNTIGDPINITRCRDNECNCNSNIQCDYAKFTGTNCSSSEDTSVETAYVLNECFVVGNDSTGIQYTDCYENPDGNPGELQVATCSDNPISWGPIDACNLQCFTNQFRIDNATNMTTTNMTTTNALNMTTTEMETTDEFDTTYGCRDRMGKGNFGSFNISFYIDCIDETITMNITYNGHKNNWFGIVFTDEIPGNYMYGEALIYTIGKLGENIPTMNNGNNNGNNSEPKLYLYNLSSKNVSGVNYVGGVNGERNWDEISKTIDQNKINIVYRQDLDETQFNVTTDRIPIRWAYGPEQSHALQYHGANRATQTMQLDLQDVEQYNEPIRDTSTGTAGVIIGSVIGAFFLIMLCVIIVWACVDHFKNKSKKTASGYDAVGGADTDVEDAAEQKQETT